MDTRTDEIADGIFPMTRHLRLCTIRALCCAAWLASGCVSHDSPSPTRGAESSRADPASALLVDGDARGTALSIEQLRALGSVQVEWSHKGAAHHFDAVPLEAIFRSAGIEPGSMTPTASPLEKRPAWKLAVVATATDGFQATFSAAELYRGMGPTEAYVAFGEGGKPLDASAGPLRLVVLTDAEGSRSVRNLTRLKVVDLRRLVPAR